MQSPSITDVAMDSLVVPIAALPIDAPIGSADIPEVGKESGAVDNPIVLAEADSDETEAPVEEEVKKDAVPASVDSGPSNAGPSDPSVDGTGESVIPASPSASTRERPASDDADAVAAKRQRTDEDICESQAI